MNEPFELLLSGIAGGVIGGIFFGGLWWTVRNGVLSSRPALWFLGSTILRTAAALAGFYLVARGHWERLLVCLLGFIIARTIVIRLTRIPGKSGYLEDEAPHAP